MNPFEVGDLIICMNGKVDWLNENALKVGGVHRVIRSKPDFIGITNHDHPERYNFCYTRFMKVDRDSKLFKLVFE